MARIIKFRAYDVFDKVMVYGNEHNGNDIWDGVRCSSVQIVNDRFEEYRYAWMQFTGLKDRNGVEVYEGDIIEYTLDFNPTTESGAKKRRSEVFWSDFRASWSVYGDGVSKRTNNNLFHYVQNGNTVTVIGNIYENRNLLATPQP